MLEAGNPGTVKKKIARPDRSDSLGPSAIFADAWKSSRWFDCGKVDGESQRIAEYASPNWVSS
jgi:hypothetical protein